MNDLLEKVKHLKKTAWIPEVQDGDGNLTDSKFAGTPYLKKDEEYPQCPNCDKPIQLFLQLNLNQLPEELKGEFGEGLIQLFYCTNNDLFCENECDAWSPFAKSVICRLVKIDGENHIENVEIEDEFSPKKIVSWIRKDDYPNFTEFQELTNESATDEADLFDNQIIFEENAFSIDSVKSEDIILVNKVVSTPEFDETEEEYFNFCLSSDKLSGWANWVQDVEYPNCRSCGLQMRLVFQLDSNDNLPFDFGDVGTGHITQCPIHKDELGFGWACS